MTRVPPLEPWLIELIRESGTPHFVFDLHVIRKQITTLRQLLPHISLLYSTKTNSAPAVIDTCLAEGMGFDAATIPEIEMLVERGVNPTTIIYTHPVKTPDEIQHAYTALGVRQFTCDTVEELGKLTLNAPNGKYFVRFSPAKSSSLYNYQHRYGANNIELEHILDYAVEQNIHQLVGLSFHVGSQSMSTVPWAKALKHGRKFIEHYYDKLPNLRNVNIGSGFPLDYGFGKPPSIEKIAETITKELARFPSDVVFLAEPGRILVGPAGTLVVSIVERLTRGKQEWLFTDASVYNGLIERIESGGRFSYPVTSLLGETPSRLYNIAGKTLDPDDIIAQHARLSDVLTTGDLLILSNCGAYSLEFFTAYHQLPRPLVTFSDSQYTHKVNISRSNVSHNGVRARQSLQPGETVFTVTGHRSKKRSRTSFQISDKMHIEPNVLGAYLNHSCAPNAGIRTNGGGLLNVVARQPIAAGEEVTVDYAMFEYELADMAKVPCQCKTPDCRKTILGYKHLPEQKKQEYRPHTATHLIHKAKP